MFHVLFFLTAFSFLFFTYYYIKTRDMVSTCSIVQCAPILQKQNKGLQLTLTLKLAFQHFIQVLRDFRPVESHFHSFYYTFGQFFSVFSDSKQHKVKSCGIYSHFIQWICILIMYRAAYKLHTMLTQILYIFFYWNRQFLDIYFRLHSKATLSELFHQ